MKKQIKYPLTFNARSIIKELLDGLPALPYLITDKTGVEVPVVTKEMRTATGAELMAHDPKEKLIPEAWYKKPAEITRMQNHAVEIRRAYQERGKEGAQEYCDAIWERYYQKQNYSQTPNKPLEL